MGGTIPEDIDQDSFTGKNDLAFAAASSSTMLLDITRDDTFTDDLLGAMEYELAIAT